MDLENQKRVKEFAEEYGAENLVVVLGAAEGEAAGLAAETVTLGDPTFAGPLTGVQLGLTVYHVCEPEMKAEFDEAVYDEQVGMMEMVLDVDDIVSEMQAIRDQLQSEVSHTNKKDRSVVFLQGTVLFSKLHCICKKLQVAGSVDTVLILKYTERWITNEQCN